MTRFNKVRPKAKARFRSDSRAPGNSRSRGKPQDEPEQKPRQNQKYAERARKRAIREAEENAKRMPALNLKMIAQDAMEKYGFEHKLSIVVNAKANAHDEFMIKKVGATLRDLRHLLWTSIDSHYARDLDQIEYCERGQRREILVKVAIADVDAFAPKGSILDAHAQTNATAVYPGKEEFPMLPEQLSCNLSSFPMDCDRLAIVVEFAVLPRGNVRFGKIYRAIVRNKAHLQSGDVGAWLGGKAPQPEMFEEMPELEEQIVLQDEASLRLCNYRSEQGALAQEARADASEDKTLGLYAIENDRAKKIIKNFMICVNSAISGLLEGARTPTIHRVVVIPKEWNGIVDIASARGAQLPLEPDAHALADFLAKEKAAAPEKFPELSQEIVKLLGDGEYAMFDKREPIDYFCLAVTDYLVGTSPNQRYMDLIIQRLVKAAVAYTPTPYSKAELTELAALCTEREHAAKKVERSVAYAKTTLKP